MNEETTVNSNEEKNNIDVNNAVEVLFEKADPVKRIIAFVIDSLLAMVIGFIPVIGGIVGALYMLLRDALPIEALDYKSVGKKLINLSVVMPENSTFKIDYGVSARRNWMWAIGPIMVFLLFIPVIGWIVDIFLGIALLVLAVIEVVKIFSDEKGQRIGDQMAKTMVIEKK